MLAAYIQWQQYAYRAEQHPFLCCFMIITRDKFHKNTDLWCRMTIILQTKASRMLLFSAPAPCEGCVWGETSCIYGIALYKHIAPLIMCTCFHVSAPRKKKKGQYLLSTRGRPLYLNYQKSGWHWVVFYGRCGGKWLHAALAHYQQKQWSRPLGESRKGCTHATDCSPHV